MTDGFFPTLVESHQSAGVGSGGWGPRRGPADPPRKCLALEPSQSDFRNSTRSAFWAAVRFSPNSGNKLLDACSELSQYWFTPIGQGVPKGWAIGVIAYLDGSSASDGSADTSHITLASIAAYKPAWDAFELAWDRVIAANAGEPVHATDLFYKGANADIAVLELAVDTIVQQPTDAFHCFTCTVNLQDYKAAREKCQFLLNPPHDTQPSRQKAICVDWCVGNLFNRLDVDMDKPSPVDVELSVYETSDSCIASIVSGAARTVYVRGGPRSVAVATGRLRASRVSALATRNRSRGYRRQTWWRE